VLEKFLCTSFSLGISPRGIGLLEIVQHSHSARLYIRSDVDEQSWISLSLSLLSLLSLSSLSRFHWSKRNMTSPPPSSAKLDMPWDQLAEVNRIVGRILKTFSDNTSYPEWRRFLQYFVNDFVANMVSTDLEPKILPLERLNEILQHSDDQELEKWKCAARKGSEEDDWADFLRLCTCHFAFYALI
jgi:hypothetical protein